MKAAVASVLNPWFSIWTQPRATIQQIIQTDSEKQVLLLAALAGIGTALDRASMKNLGDTMDLSSILMIAIIAGPLGGIVSLYFGSLLVRWTGRWIGATGTPETIRAAFAWANVPIIWALLLWLPELGLFGKELFTANTPEIDASLPLSFTYVGFMLLETTIAIWTIVVFLKCLGQVQGFTAWRALANVLLAASLFIVPILILIFAVAR